MTAKSTKTARPECRTTCTGRKLTTPAPGPSKAANTPSKLDRIVEKLAGSDGASIAELAAVTGWQAHSVRGALAGSLKKKGHVIISQKVDGIRRYRIESGK